MAFWEDAKNLRWPRGSMKREKGARKRGSRKISLEKMGRDGDRRREGAGRGRRGVGSEKRGSGKRKEEERSIEELLAERSLPTDDAYFFWVCLTFPNLENMKGPLKPSDLQTF